MLSNKLVFCQVSVLSFQTSFGLKWESHTTRTPFTGRPGWIRVCESVRPVRLQCQCPLGVETTFVCHLSPPGPTNLSVHPPHVVVRYNSITVNLQTSPSNRYRSLDVKTRS